MTSNEIRGSFLMFFERMFFAERFRLTAWFRNLFCYQQSVFGFLCVSDVGRFLVKRKHNVITDRHLQRFRADWLHFLHFNPQGICFDHVGRDFWQGASRNPLAHEWSEVGCSASDSCVMLHPNINARSGLPLSLGSSAQECDCDDGNSDVFHQA